MKNLTTPIMISNHVNWFDIVYHCVRMFPISFVSKAEMQKVPILGKVASKIQCVFL
jgi:1-acyl-sn-glycerol-3-phosphate acyltransferase